jgi:hypothetical protein
MGFGTEKKQIKGKIVKEVLLDAALKYGDRPEDVVCEYVVCAPGESQYPRHFSCPLERLPLSLYLYPCQAVSSRFTYSLIWNGEGEFEVEVQSNAPESNGTAQMIS